MEDPGIYIYMYIYICIYIYVICMYLCSFSCSVIPDVVSSMLQNPLCFFLCTVLFYAPLAHRLWGWTVGPPNETWAQSLPRLVPEKPTLDWILAVHCIIFFYIVKFCPRRLYTASLVPASLSRLCPPPFHWSFRVLVPPPKSPKVKTLNGWSMMRLEAPLNGWVMVKWWSQRSLSSASINLVPPSPPPRRSFSYVFLFLFWI